MSGARMPVYVERGDKLVFAAALAWPGWCRRGRSEIEALAALAAYAPRYAEVVKSTGDAFPAPVSPDVFDVVERLDGGSGTDFGVAGLSPSADQAGLEDDELERQLRILEACWAAFDGIADAARGRDLRKGPRGGGRDLAKITLHVAEAEDAYLNQLGARPPKRTGDLAADTAARRAVARAAVRARARGDDPADPSGTRKRWTPRRFVRRDCWHVLDHAWEIEDRVTD